MGMTCSCFCCCCSCCSAAIAGIYLGSRRARRGAEYIAVSSDVDIDAFEICEEDEYEVDQATAAQISAIVTPATRERGVGPAEQRNTLSGEAWIAEMNAELAQFDVITSRHLQAAQLDDKQGHCELHMCSDQLLLVHDLRGLYLRPHPYPHPQPPSPSPSISALPPTPPKV
uniref:Uncharacterized protein n=1 Tax=Calcidiscus leptoporus TaxID=127549 RepID=A0A7S0J1L5_9EUKA